MSLRKVNITILILVVVIFLLVLHHNFLGLSDLLKKELSDFIPEAPQRLVVKENDKEIPVVLTASEERLGGVIAVVNSIQQNTKSNVAFHIVTLNDTVDHLRSWLSKTSLKNVQYQILNFDPGMLAGKVRIDSKMPNSIKPYNYMGFLDYKKELVRKLSIKASTCSFNPGVEEIYSRTLAGSITTPPLLIVFYKRHSKINPMWNVRHLGSSAGKRYSPQFVKAAKLLHWNGHFKPWGRTASFADVWEKWYIPDPSGKFNLIRRHSEIYKAH
ncbi:putative Glycosyltransferase 8 domain-containing protein [Naja naja]|nr:putative Glycosyltransferase 8 domain-containing protein [Naja naja]